MCRYYKLPHMGIAVEVALDARVLGGLDAHLVQVLSDRSFKMR